MISNNAIAIIVIIVAIWYFYYRCGGQEGLRQIPIEEACRLCRELPASKYCDSCVQGQVQQIVFKNTSGKTANVRKF